MHDIYIKKPISVWSRELSISPKAFLLSLTKAAVSGVMLDSNGLVQNLADSINGISISDRPSYAAWTLIYRALTDALSTLVQEYDDFFSHTISEADQIKISAHFEKSLEQIEVGLSSTFFDHPDKLPLLDQIKPSLTNWLESLGMGSAETNAFHLRLKNRFSLSLHSTWIKNQSDYACIEEAINSPFVRATKIQRSWIEYSLWLQEQTHSRMFSEAFSLKQIYVPLRAYYEEKDKSKINEINGTDSSEMNKYAIDLHDELELWVRNFHPDTAIKVISGGPGSGKSSFSKMFAAYVAQYIPEVPVLFIPLHQFDPSDDLTSAVELFVRDERFLTGSPLDVSDGQERLLIIFDGLDELSMQGKAAAETANFFIDEVISKINKYNGQKLKRQVIITGRDLAIQSTENKFRGEKQILHVLPYFISDSESKHYIDEAGIIKEDQRDIWWRNYGNAKGIDYRDMPEDLKISRLTPITREPLLNYLVALSYERNKISFSNKTTLNTIYQDLLNAVHERQWDHGKHKSASHLKSGEFTRILEEISLAVWHGDGRTATINQIFERCANSNLSKYLEVFEEGAKKGVSRLLTAFYFRQSEQLHVGDKTFEFTHKSFGEYLIARRIVRAMRSIHNEITRHDEDPDEGYDEREALKRWAELGGYTTVDQYVFQFLCDEIKAYPNEAHQWQETFIRLLSYAVKNSMPMEQVVLPRFKDMLNNSRNAEELLIAAHSACAKISKKALPSNWGQLFSFGEWLKRIQGQREGPRNIRVILSCLSYLNIGAAKLDLNDFFDAELDGAILDGAFLRYCNFNIASLRRVSFRRTTLENSSFIGSQLHQSSFQESNADRAIFERALMRGVNFSSAILHRTVFDDANLTKAIFTGAMISNIECHNTVLSGANFENTNIEESRLIECNVKRTIFTNTNFTSSKLTGIDFRDAFIDGASFEDAILDNVRFNKEQMSLANFNNVDLSKCIIT